MGYHSPWLGALVSLAGLIGGYVLGILAGLRLQHLGWLAVMVSMLAGLAAIGMGGAILVMLLLLTVQ